MRAGAQHSHPVSAVDHRHLRHHCLSAAVESARVDDHRSTKASAPYPDALRIDFVAGLQVTDRVAVVLDFVERKKLAARLSFTFAEGAIVDSQCDVPGAAEVAAFFDQRLLHEAEAVADNQSRAPPVLMAVRKIKIAGAIQTATRELDFLYRHDETSIRFAEKRSNTGPLCLARVFAPRYQRRAVPFAGNRHPI